MAGPDLSERLVDRRVLHRGAFLEFRIDTVERADGSRHVRDVAGHPGAVAIVAMDARGQVALVRQWRLPADAALLEIPAGGLDVADDGTKEDPDDAARRELEEEAGLRAASWRKLGTFYTAPGFTDELMHLYLATDLSPAAEDRLHPDADEALVLSWLPWRDAVSAAERGEIRDAKSIVGLFWLARLLTDPASTPGDPTPAMAIDADVGSSGDGSGDRVVVSYRLSTREIVAASVALTRRSMGTRISGLIMIILSATAIALTGDLVSVGLLILGLAFVTGWFAAPFAWYQAHRRPDLVMSEQTVEADPRGIRYRTTLGESTNGWETFRRVHESGAYFFLDTNTGLNLFVPRRAFDPGQLATFYRLMDRAGLLTDRP